MENQEPQNLVCEHYRPLLLIYALPDVSSCISNHATNRIPDKKPCLHEPGWYIFYHPCPNLTHWGRVTHIFVGELTIIVSDNGLSPGRRQAIIWTNAGILLIGPYGTNFSEIFIGIQTFSFKKIHSKMASAKWRPFCLGLNELRRGWIITLHCYLWMQLLSML